MATTETAAPASSSALSVLRRIATAPTVGPLVALVLTVGFFSVKSDEGGRVKAIMRPKAPAEPKK